MGVCPVMTASSRAFSTCRRPGPGLTPAAIRSRPFTASWLTRQQAFSAVSRSASPAGQQRSRPVPDAGHCKGRSGADRRQLIAAQKTFGCKLHLGAGRTGSFPFQRCHLIRERVGAFQLAQSFAGTGFTQRAEKGRQPGGHVLRCWFDPVDGTAEFCKPFRLFFRFQLRQDNGQNGGFQIASGPGCRQQLEQFFLDALRRNAVQMRPQCPGSSTGG